MHEILIRQTYEYDELQNKLNQNLADKVDGVIMCWEDSTSVIIEKLHDISIHEIIQEIQIILGSNIELILDPEDE